jgi:hypothetical protein
MHDEPVFGSKVKQEPPSRTSRRAWPRLLVFAFLAVLMLVALGGTSRASELDPNETATDALDPIAGTVSDTADPVVETDTDTADPVVESVTDTVDQVVETVTDTMDPVIGTMTDTIDPVVDTVVPPTKGIIGTGGADPLDPPPRLPVPGVGVPDPGSVGVPDGARDEGRTSYDRHPAAGGDLPWSGSLTTIARAPAVAGVHPADPAPGRASARPTVPVGDGGPGSSLTLLVLLAALATAVRACKPPFLSSIVPRAVPMRGTALALSVERPG